MKTSPYIAYYFEPQRGTVTEALVNKPALDFDFKSLAGNKETHVRVGVCGRFNCISGITFENKLHSQT